MASPSPYQTYIDYCRKGQLAYQVDGETGEAIFYPRVAGPRTGHTQLAWQLSRGVGTVHATTVVFEKGMPSHNVCLIDLDEGYRMMSRVEDIPALDVRIGMRVQVRFDPGNEEQPPYPVFIPMAEAA